MAHLLRLDRVEQEVREPGGNVKVQYLAAQSKPTIDVMAGGNRMNPLPFTESAVELIEKGSLPLLAIESEAWNRTRFTLCLNLRVVGVQTTSNRIR